MKYVIFKSKNPFVSKIFGRTIGRTGPKKEYMSSKRRTCGNPKVDINMKFTGVYRFWLCITFGESENKNESNFSN